MKRPLTSLVQNVFVCLFEIQQKYEGTMFPTMFPYFGHQSSNSNEKQKQKKEHSIRKSPNQKYLH